MVLQVDGDPEDAPEPLPLPLPLPLELPPDEGVVWPDPDDGVAGETADEGSPPCDAVGTGTAD